MTTLPEPPRDKYRQIHADGFRKHTEALYAHAAAGEWSAVQSYPCPQGVNWQAGLVRKYQAELLRHHASAMWWRWDGQHRSMAWATRVKSR